MKRLLLTASLCIFSVGTLQAADAKRGETLHKDNCAACHINMTGGDGSILYTRNARRVTSLDKLGAQVRRCEANIGLGWWDEDIAEVITHLNTTYYKFPKK